MPAAGRDDNDKMNRICAMTLLSCVLVGCAAQMVQRDATESCAKQSKQAFIFDAKQSGIPLFIDSASAMVLCVGPEDVVHMPATFGADAVSASNFKGAGIVAVTPGSVADRALLKPNDIVYEFAGHPVASAADLRLEVNAISPGDQAPIKLRRNGEKDRTLSAHF
jgi:hypothetical protein